MSKAKVRFATRSELVGLLTLEYRRQSKALSETFRVFFDTPNWAKMTNSELEQFATDLYKQRWVISEWCPHCGTQCSWKGHVPDKDLKAAIEEFSGDLASHQLLVAEMYRRQEDVG